MKSLTPVFKSSIHNSVTDPLQKAIMAMWAKIENKQNRNQKFLDDKNKLFVEFQTNILPLEQKQGKQQADLLEFLIPFISRKSISDFQRDELLNWVESLFSNLRSHPFLADIDVDLNALQNKLDTAYSTFMKSQNITIDKERIENTREEIAHMFNGEMQLSDEEIISLIEDPSLLNQYIQRMNDDLADEQNAADIKQKNPHSDPFEDWFENDFEQDEFQQHESQDAKQKELDKLFKAGQLNKIYKRLASLLHPDKEQDPIKKEQKHVIMQTLSEARKNKDAFTLLQLYQTHINDGEFSFDADTLSSMQALLKEKLHLLEEEHYQAKMTNDMPTLVWRTFTARSKKQTENNMKNHASNLAEEVYEHQLIMQQNQTVAQMKKLLQQRVEQNRGWVSDMPIDLMDLFR